MEQKDKPRLAKVLGVDVGEKFAIKGHAGDKAIFCVNEKGIMCWKGVGVDNVTAIFTAINHPELIIRTPHLTELELAICKAVGAKWVSRDKESDSVDLWGVKPIKERGFYKVNGEYPIATVRDDLFPSVKPGDCICVEEVD